MDPAPEPASSGPPGTPLWVKVVGAGVLVAVLAFVVLHFMGASPTGH